MTTALNTYKKNIKVYIQVLPLSNSCLDEVKICEDNKTLYVCTPKNVDKKMKSHSPAYFKFETDGILNNRNQNDIFDIFIKDSIQQALMGVDLIIYSYGQTGSGKSSTINGLLNTFDNRGISPRIISELFSLKDEYKYELKLKFKVSCVEAYKNYVIDLINYKEGHKIQRPFKNIIACKIESETDGWKYLFQAEGRRKIIKCGDYYSNIATSVFTIYVKCVSKLISNPIEMYSKIHIIDMAGIDTNGNISCEMKSARDVGSANLNKSQLEQCLFIIRNDLIKKKQTIRDTGTLVSYLGDSLKAESLIMYNFLGHIRSTREDLFITISALNFANTARSIKPAKLKPTIITSELLLTRNLQNKLEILQEQMYLNSMLQNNDLSFNLTQPRIDQMQHAIEAYIKDKTSEISVLNVTDAIIALNIFRDICCKLEAEKLETVEKLQNLSSKTKVGSGTINMKIEPKLSIKTTRGRVNSKDSTKRNASDVMSRTSRTSKLSTKQSKISFNKDYVGNLSKTGISLGHLLSCNYQGDVSKSLMLKSNLINKSSLQITEESHKKAEHVYCSISDFNLQNDLDANNIETIWEAYKKDTNYKFYTYNSALEVLMQSSKDILNHYNNLIDILNKKIEMIDSKKYEMLKITLYLGMCSAQHTEVDGVDAEMNGIKQRLSANIVTLMKDTIQIKEEILTLIAEFKIMIEEYHRIKKEMNQDFSEYCVNTFHIKLPLSDQVLETIEDDLAILDNKSELNTNIPHMMKNTFYKFQTTLRRNQMINNKL